MKQTQQKFVLNMDSTNGFNRQASDELYQLLLDLRTNGSSGLCVSPCALLSSEIDTIAAVNRSAGLEKEAQDILKVFTNVPVTPVLRDVNTASNNSNNRALVPRNPINIAKRRDTFKIDIWKDNHIVTSIQNNQMRNQHMHFINIKIDVTGTFIITGLENVDEEIKEVIRELGGLIAVEDCEKFTKDDNNDGVEIKEITEDNVEMIEVPMPDGILKFSANQNLIDVLSEIYCTEETEDNKKIFKVPELGDFVVSPEDDPVTVFKLITGFDLSEYYNKSPENANMQIAEIAPNEDNTENKENEKRVRHRNQRYKKNKQKRKSKKRK